MKDDSRAGHSGRASSLVISGANISLRSNVSIVFAEAIRAKNVTYKNKLCGLGSQNVTNQALSQLTALKTVK